MKIQVQVSLGELVDKLTILSIKKEKIQDAIKLCDVSREEKILRDQLESLGLTDLCDHQEKLLRINKQLWEIEDLIREKERNQSFDENFIELARSVYKTNDRRFEAKAEINLKYGSDIKEVKSYEDY